MARQRRCIGRSLCRRLVSGLSHLILTGGVLMLVKIFLHTFSNEELLKLLILVAILLFILRDPLWPALLLSILCGNPGRTVAHRTVATGVAIQSLKSQISPHYLFNCLNTVSALLYKDTRRPKNLFVAWLTRSVRPRMSGNSWSLFRKSSNSKAYYFLLQVRYGYLLRLKSIFHLTCSPPLFHL